ncbi:Lipase, GDSL [Corchorus capsularis]|uniref:Lipase, GDSL n=1 Tax=Corchorus capsularis TaxID=210143 RepID=A0A1R3GAV3_COCAP|nr:Lipase, GDSL [Corchorus capsularis]
MADPGNNNKFDSLAKANYAPYGIDYPNGPTGRFSNGRNVQDVIAELLGFDDSITPFVNANDTNILQGVNYASGGAVILYESGSKTLIMRVTLKEQINNHVSIVSKISGKLGEESAKKLLSQCIYSLQIGSNDYINNYFQPRFYNTSRQYSTEQYAAALVQQLSGHTKTLYEHGAKKFALYGLGLIGCTPYSIQVHGTADGSPCVDKMNLAVSIYNEKLKTLVRQLNANLTDTKVTYLNPAPKASEFASFVNSGTCCKIGGGSGELCLHDAQVCETRDKYVFWDGEHSTEAFNLLTGESAYEAQSPMEAFPFNLKTLAAANNNQGA